MLMVTQATQDFIFSVVDANNEYNTKVMLFCLILLYLIFSLWWANKIIPFKATNDEKAKFPIYKQISVKLMRVVSTIFIIFYPLVVGIMMYRNYAIDAMLTLMITGYSVMTIIGLGIWFLFGMDWVQDLLALIGVQTKNTKGTLIRRRD